MQDQDAGLRALSGALRFRVSFLRDIGFLSCARLAEINSLIPRLSVLYFSVRCSRIPCPNLSLACVLNRNIARG